MKTTFVTSLIGAICSLIALVALSAMTVLPDDAVLHARWMAIVFALLVGSSLLAAWARSRLVKAAVIIALLIASVPAIHAADDFEAYEALSLQQLQLASREESLRRAEAELEARSTDLTTKAVEFLREEVAKLKQ